MEQIEVARRIEAPRAAVFDRFADHQSWTRWSAFARVRLEKEGLANRNGVGCVRQLGVAPFAAREEITEFEPHRRMATRWLTGPMPLKTSRGEVLFEDDGDGTLVTWRWNFEPSLHVPGVSRAVGWIARSAARRTLRGLAREQFGAG